MPNIAIPYAAGQGATRRLAEEIATALGQADCNARLIDVEVMFRIDWEALEAADAIVLGGPTHMGSAAAAFKAFMDETGDIWLRQGWADKIAAGFTVAPSGDALATLLQLAGFAAHHGMVWVGQDHIHTTTHPENAEVSSAGAALGLVATLVRDSPLAVSASDLNTARRFGLRIARAARRWSV